MEKKNIVLALDGPSYEFLMNHFQNDKAIQEKLFMKIRIFARTNPKQKGEIVMRYKSILQKSQYAVGFIGDGSNDTLALHNADLGLSLGVNDASLASSFSSSRMNISPVITILEEGKCFIENFQDILKLCFFESCVIVLIILMLNLNGMMLSNW